MTHYCLRQALANAVSRLPYESTSMDVLGICKAWREDIATMAADVGPPKSGHFLVQLDKTKWYGPGNVKWIPARIAPSFRKDNPRLRDYYAKTPAVYGEPIPKTG